jgi:hypothetical protein
VNDLTSSDASPGYGYETDDEKGGLGCLLVQPTQADICPLKVPE